MNLLVFLFRFSLFLGTFLTANDKTLRDALEKDRFSNFKIKWFVSLKWKITSSRNKLYQMLTVIKFSEVSFHLKLYYLCL